MLTSFGNHFNNELTRAYYKIHILYNFCRISGERRAAPPKEYIQDLVNIYGPACITSDLSLNLTPVEIDQVVWSTRFRTHSAIADRTFTHFGAAVFLVGDATHIYSPMGGQGVILAIRDAIFLSEAVTKHIQVSAESPDVGDTILQEIAEARHARALEIIGFTKKPLKFASLKYDPYAWWMPFSWTSLRDLTLWMFGSFNFVQSKVAWGLSRVGRR
jgi:2-polyprenyl-6-methoxyphenol hydroxylase-like FAD-dependent oxidoreductase